MYAFGLAYFKLYRNGITLYKHFFVACFFHSISRLKEIHIFHPYSCSLFTLCVVLNYVSMQLFTKFLVNARFRCVKGGHRKDVISG